MLTVHHLGISQSERIVWLCEELGIEYTLKVHDRDAVTRLAPASIRALHPAGTAPIITDGDLALAESGAIIDYIVAVYGDGRLTVGKDNPAFADFLYWYHFGNGSLMPAVSMVMVASADSPMLPLLQARRDTALAMLEDRLGKATWLAGDQFTVADIMSVFALTTMRHFFAYDLSPYPNIRAYLKRVAARPAYQSAMAKGDPGLPLLLD